MTTSEQVTAKLAITRAITGKAPLSVPTYEAVDRILTADPKDVSLVNLILCVLKASSEDGSEDIEIDGVWGDIGRQQLQKLFDCT